MKYLVIGGNAAGMSFAMKMNRNEECEIVILEKLDYVSFGACGLPYFIGGEFDDQNNMFARTVEQIIDSGVDLRVNCEVINVAKELKEVTYLNNGITFKENYDKLIIASGASPIVPNFGNYSKKNVHTLTSLKDGINLKEKFKNKDLKNVVIIGGGFIGLETLDACFHNQKNVTLIERESSLMSKQFSSDIIKYAEDNIKEKGINLLLNTSLNSIEDSDGSYCLKTSKGDIKADLIVISIGFKPNTNFIDLPKVNNALVVDKFSKTCDDFIYAIGDCALIYNQILDEMVYLPLATSANKQGRMMADYLSLKPIYFKGMLGSSCLLVLDYELARTGMTEVDCLEKKINYKTKLLIDKNHTNYYKNQSDVIFKIIYDADSLEIKGCEGIGKEGVALRMNTIALAIQTKLTTLELGYIDFGYAPPFSRTWDALNVLGNISK